MGRALSGLSQTATPCSRAWWEGGSSSDGAGDVNVPQRHAVELAKNDKRRLEGHRACVTLYAPTVPRVDAAMLRATRR